MQRRPTADARRSRPPRSVSVALLGAALCSPALLGPARWAAAAPGGQPAAALQLNSPSTRSLRRLDQLDALVADGQWAESVELLDGMINDPAAQQAVIEASPGRAISLADHCVTRLAALPPDALALYRATADAAAKKKTLAGVEGRDEFLLRDVAERSLLTSWGDQAATALGDLALLRGDYVAARRWWRRAHPRLSGPAGRPLAWALRGVDLDSHGDEVRRRLTTLPRLGGWVTHPDPDVPLGDLLARMVIASAQQGDASRARLELRLLRLLAPKSIGTLSGRSGEWSSLLAEVAREAEALAEAALAASSIRHPGAAGPVGGDLAGGGLGLLTGRLWPQPYALRAPRANAVQAALLGVAGPGATLPPPSPAPLVEPTAWDRTVLLRDGNSVIALDLLTGEPAVTRRGKLYEASGPAPERVTNRTILRLRMGGVPVISDRVGDTLPEPLPVDSGVMYARVRPTAAQRSVSRGEDRLGWRIIGRDLNRQNLPTLAIEPPEAPWEFAGPPACGFGRLHVPLRTGDVLPRVAVACYSTATGEPLWRTPVVSGQPAGSFQPAAAAPVLLRSGDTVYLGAGCGATAALCERTGAVRWVVTHPPSATPLSTPTATLAGPALMLDADRLLVAPTGSGCIEALDTATGRRLWAVQSPTAEARFLGVQPTSEGPLLVVGGRQLAGVCTSTGRVRYLFPDSPKAGVRGRGRGCLAGGEVFWPTRDRVLVLNAATGQPTRQPIDVADLGGEGVNLTPSRGCLIAAGAAGVAVLGPVNREKTETAPSTPANDLPGS